MKNLVVLTLFLAVAGVAYAADTYTTKFDNIDIDQILHNERLLKPYVNCLLTDTKCTADANELKRVLPEALVTNCQKCSEKQKQGAEKVISYLAKNKPEIWSKILAKYDKNNEYRTKYAETARRLGVPL
uniref:Chemosensory protein n=1 Tax=Phenacoccus solenopsis TaxID=483260 RepID=A0A0C5KA81_9HEMI|nr:chemosensory protein [Phenacoccus solenopsis]